MRNSEQILKELNDINAYVLKGIPDNDMQMMLSCGSTLVTYIASTAAMVAESGKLFNQAKTNAYHVLALSSVANQKYYSPSLAKDYINSKCSEAGYVYELACRMNAAVTHSLDMIRTAISAEKQLLANLNYGNNG